MMSTALKIGDLSESLEDYIEVIYNLSKQSELVYVSDIARIKSVKMPSVNKAINRLCDLLLLEHDKYGSIELTEKGNKLATEIINRHQIIKQFFINTLGVDEKTSEIDACKIEHYLNSKTVKRLTEYVKKTGGDINVI